MIIGTYAPVFMIVAVATSLALLFFLGHTFLGKKAKFSQERMQPYESGSESSGANHVKLSVKFYLTAILFVVFDIEVVLMYPWVVSFKSLGWTGYFTMLSFVALLVVALAYVWKKGALEWEK